MYEKKKMEKIEFKKFHVVARCMILSFFFQPIMFLNYVSGRCRFLNFPVPGFSAQI